ESDARHDHRGATGGRRRGHGSRPVSAIEGEAQVLSASLPPFSRAGRLHSLEGSGPMPDSATNPSRGATENRYSDRRLRGRPDAGNLPRVDGGVEEGIDPALPACPPREGGEVRVPDPARAEGPVERVLRSQGGDAVPGAAAARGARLRLEPLAGAEERDAPKVLSAHRPRSRGAPRGPRDLGHDDARRGAGPGRRPMTAADAYLNEVRRSMAGMANPIREDILRELRGHIAESSAANGGNLSASLAALGSAREVGHRYRELYGYGTLFKILFSAIAIVLGSLVLVRPPRMDPGNREEGLVRPAGGTLGAPPHPEDFVVVEGHPRGSVRVDEDNRGRIAPRLQFPPDRVQRIGD